MNRTTAVMKMYIKDKFSYFYLPWIILFSSFFVNYIVGYFIDQNEAFYTGGLMSIFIYMFVMGIMVLVYMFPFALGLSVRRTDFFLGTAGFLIGLSAFTAFILILIAHVEQWTGSWGVNLHFFNLPYLNDGSIVTQWLVYFLLLLNLIFLGLSISSIGKRYGRNGMFTFSIIIFLISSILSYLITYNHWWVEIWHWFSRHTAFELVLWSIPLTAIYLLTSFQMLRKSSIS